MKLSKRYKYPYTGTQTPIERLRNHLSTVFTLVQLTKMRAELISKDLVEGATDDLTDIRLILDDIEYDYTKARI